MADMTGGILDIKGTLNVSPGAKIRIKIRSNITEGVHTMHLMKYTRIIGDLTDIGIIVDDGDRKRQDTAGSATTANGCQATAVPNQRANSYDAQVTVVCQNSNTVPIGVLIGVPIAGVLLLAAVIVISMAYYHLPILKLSVG